MLETVMRHINNFFPVEKVSGIYTVQDGSIALPFLHIGQYFRIIGSVFNDGVYRYPETNLRDETFEGAVWALAVPKLFLTLVEEIKCYQDKNGVSGPYISESFGGYSYSKATNSQGVAVGWQEVFAGRLNEWRRIGGI